MVQLTNDVAMLISDGAVGAGVAGTRRLGAGAIDAGLGGTGR